MEKTNLRLIKNQLDFEYQILASFDRIIKAMENLEDTQYVCMSFEHINEARAFWLLAFDMNEPEE